MNWPLSLKEEMPVKPVVCSITELIPSGVKLIITKRKIFKEDNSELKPMANPWLSAIKKYNIQENLEPEYQILGKVVVDTNQPVFYSMFVLKFGKFLPPTLAADYCYSKKILMPPILFESFSLSFYNQPEKPRMSRCSPLTPFPGYCAIPHNLSEKKAVYVVR